MADAATPPPPPPGLLRAVRFPLVLLALLAAEVADVAQRRLFPSARADEVIGRIWLAALVAAGVLLAQRVLLATLDWAATNDAFGHGARGARSRGFGGMLPLARRATNIAVAVLGVLLVLDQLGVSISPLLAGFGITGVAVALALQPLLTNLFAGSYVLSDASIQVGDFVALAGGPEGRVESIGWRATRLRDPEHDPVVVIVPNTTLAAAIVTNYGPVGPTEAVAVFPLARTADLEQAERAAIEELQTIVSTHPDVDPGSAPLVRFVRVSDTRVELRLRVRARTGEHVPALTHELVRRVGDRFRVDGVAQG